MQVFRQYLDEKLEDPEFNKTYFDNCAICPTTVRIIDEISKSSLLAEEIALTCGITVKTLRDLEAADKCCRLSIKKLCDFFDLPQPENCLQLQKTS